MTRSQSSWIARRERQGATILGTRELDLGILLVIWRDATGEPHASHVKRNGDSRPMVLSSVADG